MGLAALRDIGLEDQEARIYLHLLKRGPDSQQGISDKTGILRQTVYDLMNKMVSKGYVSVSLVGKRKFYSAAEPRLLLQGINDMGERFERAMPGLEKLRGMGAVQITSESFIGIEGLKNLVNLTLGSSGEILWLSDKNMTERVFKDYYFHNYAQKRIENKIPIRLLIEPTKAKDWNTDRKVWRETKRHPLVRGMPASYVIFDDKVIIYSLEGDALTGVYIQNGPINESFRKIFYKLWKEAV